MAKRLFDLTASLIGIIFLSPLMLVVALAIWTQRDGPIVFAQERVGQKEQPFVCYKFRTMPVDTPQVATHELAESDISALGAKLRRYKLDELPQLYNVLAGDMSLVGPRPCLPSQVDLVDARSKVGVFALRPGITGLGQIRGVDMRNPEELAKIDAEYARTRTFLGDLSIIVSTFLRRSAR